MEADGEDCVMMCMRVADMPIPPVPAVVKSCSKCGAQIWLSRSAAMDIGEATIPIGLQCILCAKKTHEEREAAGDSVAYGVSRHVSAEALSHLLGEDSDRGGNN